MKRILRSKTLLIVIIALALIGFTFIARTEKPTLTLERSRIEYKYSINGIQYAIVRLTLKYHDPSLWNRWFKDKNREGPVLKEIKYSLIDQKSGRHTISEFGMWSNQLAPTARQFYSVLMDIPIGNIPRSLGKLTLVTEFSTEKSEILPFSIVVRKK